MPKTSKNINPVVSQINDRLKAARTGCVVEQRGNKLALVATLPPRPGSKRTKRCQQRIPLGVYANTNGLKRAESLAKLVGIQLAEGKFRWSDWVEEKDLKAEPKKAIEDFRKYLKLDEYTFRQRFIYFGLNKLNLNKPITVDELINVIKLTKEDTRMRQSTCERMSQFASFLGIELDTKSLEGNYGYSKKVPRNLPSDKQIENIISSVENDKWRNIFWLCATFGLRNHEAFFCSFEELEGKKVLRVNEGKTGDRFPCFPMPPKWLDYIDLNNLPKLNCSHHNVYGQRTAGAWRRQTNDVNFTIYALRHSFAVRCHMAGIPTAIAAKWLGHSEEVHCRTYRRWITQDLHLLAWENAIKKFS